MSRETQAEMFIRILTDLWNEDHRRRMPQAQNQLHKRVTWFVQEFLTETASGRRPPGRFPKVPSAEKTVLRQIGTE